MFTCQVSGLSSLLDIESTLQAQRQHHYHLASQTISRSALGRAKNAGLSVLYFTVWTALSALYESFTQTRLWLEREAVLT